MRKTLRVKLQSQEDPSKFKYITTWAVKVGDTLRFKWNKAWTVIKITEKKEGQSDIFTLGVIAYLVLMGIVLICMF